MNSNSRTCLHGTMCRGLPTSWLSGDHPLLTIQVLGRGGTRCCRLVTKGGHCRPRYALTFAGDLIALLLMYCVKSPEVVQSATGR